MNNSLVQSVRYRGVVFLADPSDQDGVRLPEHEKTTAEDLQKAGALFKQLQVFFKDHFAGEVRT